MKLEWCTVKQRSDRQKCIGEAARYVEMKKKTMIHMEMQLLDVSLIWPWRGTSAQMKLSTST